MQAKPIHYPFPTVEQSRHHAIIVENAHDDQFTSIALRKLTVLPARRTPFRIDNGV